MNIAWITLLFSFIIFAHTCVSSVRIENNGYKGITISFSEKVLQKPFDFEKLKVLLRNASEVLFHATRNRSYFEEFVILVPPAWSESYVCDGDATQVPQSVDVHVTDSAEIHSLTAQHSRGCGQRGDLIYMPREWLAGDIRDLAIEFVQQWSTFRYGVFPENPETPGSCFASSTYSWVPSGCYNVELDVEPSFDENGLPVCYFPNDLKEKENLLSSIMFSSNSTKVLDYCDGSETLPHNPVIPTLHNRICGGKSAWSVIRNTDDFLYGRNLPVGDSKTPIFRCFKESKPHVTLIVQDTDTEARSEIRYALFYFLYNIARDFTVSLGTFSNDTLTENADPLQLPLQDEDQLKSLLLANLKLNKRVENVCLVCGLRKAYKISADSHHPLRVIVLLAPASSLSNSNMLELTELIRENEGKAVLHMLVLENTGNEDISSSLVDTMRESRGRISWIKNDRVFMFTEINTALVDASKNFLKTEDNVFVIYQKTRLKVASDFSDIFMTPKSVEGTLLYSIQCKNRGDILSRDEGCSILSQELQSPVCESRLSLEGKEESPNERKYSFDYVAGSEGSTCVSLALLKLASSENVFRVRGWLSENKITPGRNALIIYAEVLGSGMEMRVEAGISGPGLTDFRLELRDNGNGDPDIIKGDNIFSRYFTSFTQKGTYMVSIHASASTSDENSTKDELKDSQRFVSQAKVIGSFRVTEDPPKEDIIPPNRVSDLKVISIDSNNRTATLQWTAPGDNYDDGQAKRYCIKLSRQWTNLVDIAFDQKENILLNTDDFVPANSGTVESLKIQCPVGNDNISYFAALKPADDKNNEGKISNIIQIHFKEKSFTTLNPIEVTTEISEDGKQTLYSTDSPAEMSTGKIESSSTKDETTPTTTTETIEGIFIEKKTIIIAASTSGAILLLLIIINVVICCCCFRKAKKQESPKKMSRNASLRPPYNLNIAYRQGSESSFDENAASHSMSTLVDPSSGYSSSNTDNKYTYHTNRSLMNKKGIPNIKNNLGFKPVQPMPAYATSSLSRFEARSSDIALEDDQELSHTRSNGPQQPSQYKIYLTNDWRNMQDVLQDKVLYRIINTSNEPPQICGNNEKRTLQLPNNSQPAVYYLALKALDKSGNEGKLSNTVQLSIVQPDSSRENITSENETNEDTNTDSGNHNNKEKKYMYIIAGSASGIIILIILVNILVWIACFKKYKKLQTTAANEAYMYSTKALQTRENTQSVDEDAFRNEYENSLACEATQRGGIPPNHNSDCEVGGRSNPMLLYAEVQKRSKIQDSATSAQNNSRSNTQQTQIQNQRENDLGFV